MKRIKLISFLSLALMLSMLLSSCSLFSPSLKLKNLFDGKATPEKIDRTFEGSEVISDLTSASCQETEKVLFYFTSSTEGQPSYKKHTVYNIERNKVVFSATENANTRIEVDLNSFYYTDTENYFTVKTTTWKLDADNKKIGSDVTNTALFDKTGKEIADAQGSLGTSVMVDLLLFDNKFYRVTGEGSFEFAFEQSALAKTPQINTKGSDYYYAVEDDQGAAFVAVYDLSLSFVSKYKLPAYADLTSWVILENGDIFVQYIYPVEDLAKDFTFVSDEPIKITTPSNGVYELEALRKYVMTTEVIDAKKGKADEVKCDYFIDDAENLTLYAEYATTMGINLKKIPVYAAAYEIKNDRLSTTENSYFLATITNKGQVKTVAPLNGEQIEYFGLISEDRWAVNTTDATYLVNGKGEVIGDVSNAKRVGDFLYANGKIYSLDLQVIFDYEAKNLIYKSRIGNSLLFTNTEGEVFLYTGSDSAKKIIEKDSDLVLDRISSNYFTVIDSSNSKGDKYYFYNDRGEKILTIEDNDYISGSNYFSTVSSNDDAALIQSKNSEGKVVYYRLG